MNKRKSQSQHSIRAGQTDSAGYTYHYIHDSNGGEWFKTSPSRSDDLPNTVWSSGRQEWHPNTMLHRLTGPALITEHGIRRWYVHGKNITSEVEQWMQANHYGWPFTEDQQMEFILKFG